jgi:hypothetical protein
MVEMLVADGGQGRVAFDIVDERPDRNIDDEGLLLLALEHHAIRLAEMDSVSINAEPRAGNAVRIWLIVAVKSSRGSSQRSIARWPHIKLFPSGPWVLGPDFLSP